MACARESLRDFHWSEYSPLLWILAAQLLVLFLGSTLGAVWSMATVGQLMALVLGDRSLHYPGSFYVLPSFFSFADTILYWVPASFLIPLMLIRVFRPWDQGAAPEESTARRLRRAVPAAFCAMGMNIALLFLWQWAVRKGPYYWIHSLAGGAVGDVATWAVAAAVGYAIGAVFLYVPIHAVRPGATFRGALAGGTLEGVRLVGFTLFIIFFFLWPALPFLAAVQLRPVLIITKFRPELIPALLAIYAVLSSLATYLIYSSAARLHGAVRRSEP